MRSTFFCPRLGHIWATNLYDYGVKRAIGSQPRACGINTGYVSDMPVTHEVAGSSSVIPTREFGLYHAQCWSTGRPDRDKNIDIKRALFRELVWCITWCI